MASIIPESETEAIGKKFRRWQKSGEDNDNINNNNNNLDQFVVYFTALSVVETMVSNDTIISK
jgi:hypothetical protein